MSPAQTGPGHPKVTPKTIAEVRRRIEVWPAGATVYADFFELFLMPYADDREKHCLDPEWHCGVWQQDLDGDSTDEVLLLQMGPYRANDRLLLYGRDGKSFTRLGMAVIPRLEFFDDWRKALATERPKTERQRWPDLKIDGHQITIVTGAAQY